MSGKIKADPIYGIDVGVLHRFAGEVTTEPAAGLVSFGVVAIWQGGANARGDVANSTWR